MKLKSIALLTASSLFLAACGGDKAATETATDKAAAETAAATKTDGADTEADPALASLEQKLSYIVGTNLAGQFKRDDINLDITAFKMAIEDVQSEAESRLTQEEIQTAIQTMQAQAQAKQQAAQAELSAKNIAEGTAYLEANAKKEGVVVTESGLQYKELVAGEGEIPTEDKTVVVHYKGMLTDGTVFDSSYERGQPAEFPVTGVIKGWIEALQLMNVGDKFELTIPSDIAYGSRGSAPKIGPDAVLVFEVELIEIK
ncbi:FKBP-type peptidyl-prolyl cis-trans isomerase [Paraglaciecola aquimarina]|uniref:Peptidyl-prolyl cis-trans isomerase n=1 Tax=Paraglaciecola algarum TaxID=3050085 RepID=A0ABS9DFB4_9ALTE|nr:FKBP-type peptidyl-prolyl cis-trans isomerase [Paraglaciecola sp. G1-23]MCF2950484.1 FKBP-type peptidyl-prolyl cis-trans isomerase [Paraglaciecola sp. G1-23]